MNKKSYLRAFMLACFGGVFGIFISKFISSYVADDSTEIGRALEGFLMENMHYMQIFIIVFVLIPAVYFLIKGHKIMKTVADASEDNVTEVEESGKKALNFALSFNMTFTILNFMVFGSGFSREMPILVMLIGLALFVVSMTITTLIEFNAIKTLQKYDGRLKGDPSKFNFHKEYLKSCDEAEQLEIYKAAYKSFQMTKVVGIICLLIATIGNMLLDTGILPVILTGVMLLALIVTYSGHAMSKSI